MDAGGEGKGAEGRVMAWRADLQRQQVIPNF